MQPARRVLAALLVAALGACGTPPSAAPSDAAPPSEPAPSVDSPADTAAPPASTWHAAHVEQPASVTDAPSDPPVFCSPCHGTATLLFGLAEAPFGLLAVGFEQPPPKAAVWRSTDQGDSWARVRGLPATDGSSALAVAAGALRAVVGGSGPGGAALWSSRDGTAWSAATIDGRTVDGGPGAQVRAVAARGGGGFVAAGVRLEAGRRVATFWSSPDGATWRREPDAPGGGESMVLAMTASPAGLVAVGAAGSETRGAPLTWTSGDGVHWVRGPSPSGGGVMRAVSHDGDRFVAVGLSGDDTGAAAWTSGDGRTWTRAPDGAAMHSFSFPTRMHAVAAGPAGLLAGGWKGDHANGSAGLWTTPDGIDWTREPDEALFSGGEVNAIVLLGDREIAVGVSGYPDNDQAAAWWRDRAP